MHWLTIYKKSTLPEKGWIQQCFMCHHATSHTVEYNKDEYIHTVYLCKYCQKKYHSEKNKKIYVQYVEQYIEEHTPQPFAVPTYSLSPPKIISTPNLAPDLPRPHTIHLHTQNDITQAQYHVAPPPLPPPQKKRPTIPIHSQLTPLPPQHPHPPQHKSLYASLFERTSKKLSSYIHKIYKPVEPNPPPPLSPPFPNEASSDTSFTSIG